MEKKEGKKKNTKKYIICFIIVAAIIYGIIFSIKYFTNGNIKSVKRVLKEKYYNITCLDSKCYQIVAYNGNKTGKTKVTLLTGEGREVASYTYKYNVNAKTVSEPYMISNNYFIYKTSNVSSGKVTSYSIGNKKGKEIYKTKNTLKVLNDNLVIEDDTNKSINSYVIINSKGKVLFNNVNDYDSYASGKIVYIEVNESKELLNEKGEIILTDYSVIKDVKNEDGDSLYLIIKDTKNNSYNFYSINKGQIIGDSFNSYTVNKDNTLEVTKKENNNIVTYTIDTSGKQKRLGIKLSQSELVSQIKKNIDTSKYNVYSTSVNDKDQKYIFVDDITGKSFGIYNLTNKKYTKLYDYKKDLKSFYSTIYTLSSEKNNYYQISCSSSCEKEEFIVYDLNNSKVLFKSEGSDSTLQNYYQYTNDYKVIKYSYSSKNKDKKGKYVLLNKDNKEIVSSNNNIIVVDEDVLIGKPDSSSVLLYSSKANKVLNKDSSLASKITVDKKVLYKYAKDDKTIIINDKGKEIVNISSSLDLIYSDNLIIYLENNKVNLVNATNGKVKKYKLKVNEKLNDAKGNLIPPYRGTLFINNTMNNYIKIVNNKGKIIKKIKKAELQSLYYNDEGNVVIITRKDIGNSNLYGLYIAK